MLFTRQTMDGLVAGTVTLAFRRWAAPRVKVGTRTRTRVGIVEVLSIQAVEAVSAEDAVSAGFVSQAAAQKWVDGKGDASGQLYRIGIRLAGPDTRIELRNQADLSQTDVDRISQSLGRMDKVAEEPWTLRYLNLIRQRPAVLALTIAAEVGMERDLFKRRVRRLKELGLTESLDVGYRLSPRGIAYLAAID